MTERTPSTRAGQILTAKEPAYRGLALSIEREARADALREVGELRAALQRVVDLADEYSSEDTYGVYPMRLFQAAADARPLLAQPPAPDPT